MREIKLRAWDSEANIMVYSDHRTIKLHDVYYGFEMNENGSLECCWEGEFTESHALDGGKLDNIMQFTGLHDKYGVEIFEGDIVRVTDDDERTDFSDGGIGTVCGLEELYMWYIDGEVDNGLFDISQSYYIEVLGNIYENTELVEVQE